MNAASLNLYFDNAATGRETIRTCLDYFGFKGVLPAGRVSNMYEIADLLARAQKVISL